LYVGFVDLVKAYDTANHSLILRVLEQYGAPPKFVTAIQTIYTDNVCILKIEKETIKIPQIVSMRQGNNMAPKLFLLLMTAFSEMLEIVWREQALPILKVMTASDDNVIKGKICSHTLTMFTSKTLTAYKILQCLYVDDDEFQFGLREDLKRGMELIFHHFGRFDLEMHIGRGASPSKIKCIFFPPPSACTMPEYRCYTDPTCLPPYTHQHPPPPTHRTTCTKLDLPHGFPYWLPKNLGLGLGASEMEIKVHYRQLARKYHPDKNDPSAAGLTAAEASDFFKLLNNANEYLKESQ